MHCLAVGLGYRPSLAMAMGAISTHGSSGGLPAAIATSAIHAYAAAPDLDLLIRRHDA